MDFLKEIVKEIGDDFTQLASDIDENPGGPYKKILRESHGMVI